MSIGEEEEILSRAIHVKRTRLMAQNIKVQGDKKLGATHGSTWVTGLYGVNHAKDIASNLSGEVVDRGGHGGDIRVLP